MTTEAQVYLPDLDFMDMKQINPLSQEDVTTYNKQAEDGSLVCSVCTSTLSVSPFPPWARDWLTAVGGRALVSGVCVLCAPWLRQSVRYWERAKKAQATLLRLQDTGPLTLSRLRKLNSSIAYRPFVRLTKHNFGPFEYKPIICNEDQLLNNKPHIGNDSIDELEGIINEENYNVEYLSDNDNKIEVLNDEAGLDPDDNEPIIERYSKIDNNLDTNNAMLSLALNCENDGTTTMVEDSGNNEMISDDDSDFKWDDGEPKKMLPDNNSDSDSNEPNVVLRKKLKTNEPKTILEKNVHSDRKSDKTTAVFKKTTKNDFVDNTEITVAKLKDHVKKDLMKKIKYEIILKYFDIKPYTVKEQKENMLKNKMTDAYSKSLFKCEMCLVGFMEQEQYDRHVAEHPKTGKTCRVCLQHYKSSDTFIKHMRWHSSRWKFNCKLCPQSTHEMNIARNHAAMHEGKTLQCKICGKNYKKRCSLNMHLHVRHSDAVCNLCGHAFFGDKGLRCHRNLKHKGEDATIPEDGPQCAECDIRFKSDTALETHRRRKHRCQDRVRRRPSGRPLSAPAPPVDLRRVTKAAQPVECEQCGETLNSVRLYHIHFMRKHPTVKRAFKSKLQGLCNVCGSYVSNLTQHMLRHGAPSYHCSEPGCGKSYHTITNLRIHQGVHSSSALRYQCTICGKRFAWPSNLNRHFTYAHSTIRDVKCEYCNKYFKHRAEMQSHANYVHLNKPWPRKKKSAAETPKHTFKFDV